ncbi:MAG: tail fiber domain-containing protein [Dysgonomonas sp.]|nr:tail fiber domain-containing protein [Dysgonomonas sp.]
MKLKLTLIYIFILFTNYTQAQVTIGSGKSPETSAVLELDTDALGLLLPRVTLSSTSVYTLNNEATHVKGMLVYNTATAGNVKPGIYYNSGSEWVRLDQSNGSGTTDNDTFVGNEVVGPYTGGALTLYGAGTASDPFKLGIKDGDIITAKLANDAVTTVKIANRTIIGEDLNRMNATDKQVLTWVGDATTGNWVPTTINNNDDDYIVGNEVTDVIANQGLYREGLGTTASPYKVGIANAGVTAPKLNQMGAKNGQVLKWDDTNKIWKADDDLTGGDGGTPIEPWQKQGTTDKATANTDNIYQMGKVAIGTATSNYNLEVAGTSYTSSNSYVMGNMGVGTTTLSHKLNVTGNSHTSGYAKIGGDNTLSSSAQLELADANRGLLLNRVALTSLTDVVTVASPATGMVVYNTKRDTDNNLFPGTYYFDGSKWVPMTGWLLTGNSGTTTGTNFLGTIDDKALMFKVNNQQSGYISNSSGTSTSFGYQALKDNLGTRSTAFGHQALTTGGTDNIAMGYQALQNNKADSVIAIGNNALKNNTGKNNIGIGNSALLNNITGRNNIAIGTKALSGVDNSRTSGNTAIGIDVLSSTEKSVHENTIIGYRAFRRPKMGNYNTAVGARTLENAVIRIEDGYPDVPGTGDRNTAMGWKALFNCYDNDNTAVGYAALRAIFYGKQNVAVGKEAMDESAERGENGYNNNTAVGTAAFKFVLGSQNVAVGDSALYYIHHNKKNEVNYNAAMGSGALKSIDFEAFGYNGAALKFNTVAGYKAMGRIFDGQNNVAIGHMAGYYNTFGSNNIIIGAYAGEETFDTKDITNKQPKDNNLYIGKWIKGDLSGTNYRVGINGAVNNGYVLYVNGGTVGQSSDRRLKKNINNINYGLPQVMKLRPVTYQFKSDDNNKVNLGFIAQEVKEIIPEVVSGTEGDVKKGETLGMAYGELTAVLVRAIQDQQGIIEKQQQSIDALLKRIENLENK